MGRKRPGVGLGTNSQRTSNRWGGPGCEITGGELLCVFEETAPETGLRKIGDVPTVQT